MATPSNSEEAQALSSHVVTVDETSGFICDVGYSTEHYFKSRTDCAVCGRYGNHIWESGWCASRLLHVSKDCRGYYELDDGGLCWKRTATQDEYDYIIDACNKALERDEKAKDATGRKCQTCGTTRGVGYYGMWPDPLVCFCKRDHKAWILSPAWEAWQDGKYELAQRLAETKATPDVSRTLQDGPDKPNRRNTRE